MSDSTAKVRARSDAVGQKLARTAKRLADIRELNNADWHRIEAALHMLIESAEFNAPESNPRGQKAMRRTYDKVQRINNTGDYTIQADGRTIKERRGVHHG